MDVIFYKYKLMILIAEAVGAINNFFKNGKLPLPTPDKLTPSLSLLEPLPSAYYTHVFLTNPISFQLYSVGQVSKVQELNEIIINEDRLNSMR